MSEKPKHTPGPWRCVRNAADSQWLIACEESQDNRGYVATAATTNASDEANARLIAASPELLESLLLVMDWIKNWSPSFAEDGEWADAERRVKAAIAKATGS